MASSKLKLTLMYCIFMTQTRLSNRFFHLYLNAFCKVCVLKSIWWSNSTFLKEISESLVAYKTNMTQTVTVTVYEVKSLQTLLSFLSPSFCSSVFQSLLICVPEETYEVMSSQMGGEPRVQTGGSKNVKVHC